VSATADGSAQLERAVKIADAIIDLVSKHAPEGVMSRDRNDQFLALAFGRAFRCFRSIRDVAGNYAEGDDAAVLTRALAVIALRSLWLATPEDPDERIRRGRMVELDGLKHLLTHARSVEALKMDPGTPSTDLTPRVEELEALGVDGMPSDEAIAHELGLEHVYAVVYRSTSHVAHYSVPTALRGFDVSGIEGEISSFDGLRIRFLDGDPAAAEQALLAATLIYVSFLEKSEFVVHHGVFDAAKELLESYADSRREA